MTHSVVLSWTESDSNATFAVYRNPGSKIANANAPFNFALVTGLAGTTYTDTSVTPGTWTYIVIATDGSVQSAPSNQVEVTVTVAPPVLTVTSFS